jgi:hypothetical protein
MNAWARQGPLFRFHLGPFAALKAAFAHKSVVQKQDRFTSPFKRLTHTLPASDKSPTPRHKGRRHTA